jgi:hypothetical protein
LRLLRQTLFLWYDARMKRRRTVHEILADEGRIEPDLFYWLEHVAHWHALLFAVIAVLSIVYLFSDGTVVWAG